MCYCCCSPSCCCLVVATAISTAIPLHPCYLPLPSFAWMWGSVRVVWGGCGALSVYFLCVLGLIGRGCANCGQFFPKGALRAALRAPATRACFSLWVMYCVWVLGVWGESSCAQIDRAQKCLLCYCDLIFSKGALRAPATRSMLHFATLCYSATRALGGVLKP